MREVWNGKEKVGLTISVILDPILLSSLQGPQAEEVGVGVLALWSRIA